MKKYRVERLKPRLVLNEDVEFLLERHEKWELQWEGDTVKAGVTENLEVTPEMIEYMDEQRALPPDEDEDAECFIA